MMDGVSLLRNADLEAYGSFGFFEVLLGSLMLQVWLKLRKLPSVPLYLSHLT
jgi:hypothetical protein